MPADSGYPWMTMRQSLHRFEFAVAILFLVSTGGPSGAQLAAARDTGYRVDIASDASPRMRAEDVAQAVASAAARPIQAVQPDSVTGGPRAIPSQPEILSVECLRKESPLSRFPSVRPALETETVWIVLVKARFFRPHYNSPPTISDTTFYLVDDETGNILGRGTGLLPAP